MKRYFHYLSKIFLVACLLFTCLTVPKVSAEEEYEQSNNRFTIEVLDDSSSHYEIAIHNTVEDSTYTIQIVDTEDGKYLWKAAIRVNDKVISESELLIQKIKSFDKKEFEQIVSDYFTGNGNEDYFAEYLAKTFVFASSDEGGKNSQRAVVASTSVSIAAGPINTTNLAVFHAALFRILSTSLAINSYLILEDRANTSTVTNSVRERDTAVEHWEDFTGIPRRTTTSATRHISMDGVREISNRLNRDRDNNGDLELFTSTSAIGERVLAVYDINSRLVTNLNRHLGNHLDGSVIADRAYGNERLDLNGYTVYLIYNHESGYLFHAHFVPQSDRSKETKYQRYRGGFDLKLFPRISHAPAYNKDKQKTDAEILEWERMYDRALQNRNLTRDTNGRKSVVPYK
ncbi:hypothetical protein NST23_07895 [Brevibacillus sp. FSL K6-0770]|uniref:hypothetical protein n=1 Tax=Brevibacillus sp. FSL K6-0770 TaxID=2954673 RepID=UPI0030F9ABD6